jgi:hypothetical protein
MYYTDVSVVTSFGKVIMKALKKGLNLFSIGISIVFSTLLCADNLFTDGFESGDLSHTENGVAYAYGTNTSVSTENKLEGDYALRFRYKAAADGKDSFSEQRLRYPQTNELWIKFDIYIPTNYVHRTQNGASNNKFLAIYRNDYRDPGFQVNWSLNPNGTGGSDLSLHRYRNGAEQEAISPSGGIGKDFLSADDLGKWINIIAHVKTPSNESANDGVMQMWKNGVLVCDENELNNYGGQNENYMDELYLLGWSNSGFAEDTIFFIDNIVIDNKPFVRPKSPTNFEVY